jgi:hypothetical protein
MAHGATGPIDDNVLDTHPSLANSNGRLSDGSEPFLKDWAFLMDFLGVRYHSF